MIDTLNNGFLDWIPQLSWFQYLLEAIASILFIASITANIKDKSKLKILRNFLRSSSFLIAFASIAIPWMIQGLF